MVGRIEKDTFRAIAGGQRPAGWSRLSRHIPEAVGSRLLLQVGCVVLCMFGFVMGCSQQPSHKPTDGRLHVLAGIPPLAYLVEQIGGEHVNVDVMVQPGQDPHTFESSPQQAVALARAEVFFKIDMPFERVVLEKVQEGNRRLVVVDATAGIQKLPLDRRACEEHEHDHGATMHADELDPHVWLSPPLLKTMAANIAAALSRADPKHKQEYQRNLTALHNRLDDLHQRVKKMLKPYRGQAFCVFHPGFAYFGDAYGLKEVPVQVGGQTPSPKQLRALIQLVKKEKVKTVFVQPEFDPRSAQIVAEAIGGHVVSVNGLGRDVLADVEDIAKKMEKAMKDER
jgi:zinc transport system substrate-binding protein